jgi:hypothetical protein
MPTELRAKPHEKYFPDLVAIFAFLTQRDGEFNTAGRRSGGSGEA